jgi:hypothetical protein
MRDYLVSTFELIDRAYPDGVPDEEYLPLLFFLSEHLSIRTVAYIAEQAKLADLRLSYYNDVLLAMQQRPDHAMVIARLSYVGLAEWVDEPE